ncbi:hypothetical protein [Flavobacterium sp.]|uniref:hypothetical protein n=1 Tax=Flavobacterium sp. TaxID=239 RepID=UPI00374D7CE7
MTDNEIKILLRLNKSRSQNNIDDVLSEELEIPKNDVEQALNSLLQKGYIYEDSNVNQKALGIKAWKITLDGRLKVSEITAKEVAANPVASSINDENEELKTQNLRLQNSLLEVQIPNEKNSRKHSFRLVLLTGIISILSTLIGLAPTIIESVRKQPQVPSTDNRSCNPKDSVKVSDTSVVKVKILK